MLAPLALGVFALVFIAIVLGSGGGGSSGTSKQSGTTTQAGRTSTTSKQKTTTTQAKGGKSTYTVKVGDTLGGIAQSTGVPVEKLLELNPDLDPQALVSGQKVKLR
jgi:LysM repeat protein